MWGPSGVSYRAEAAGVARPCPACEGPHQSSSCGKLTSNMAPHGGYAHLGAVMHIESLVTACNILSISSRQAVTADAARILLTSGTYKQLGVRFQFVIYCQVYTDTKKRTEDCAPLASWCAIKSINNNANVSICVKTIM